MLACISGCSGVIGCKVATGGVLRVKKFAQHGLIVGFKVATWLCPEREKVRPARSKHPKFDVFEVAGRILSRVEWGRGRTGRILSRLPARYCHRPWLGHRPRPRRHTLRCLGTPTSASVGVLQH